MEEANATAGRCIKIVFLPLFGSEFPPITNEHQRSDYKREFDRDHQEYKDLQAELDAINKNLSDVDRELDELQEGSPQYLVIHAVHMLTPLSFLSSDIFWPLMKGLTSVLVFVTGRSRRVQPTEGRQKGKFLLFSAALICQLMGL